MNDYPYQPVRQRAISALGIEAGDTVIDLFCGTGVNFGQILTQMGGNGTIIGVDGSPGMLLQARKRIQTNNYNENRIKLYEKDLLTASGGFFSELLPSSCIPKVLITLGPAGLPDWETFWHSLYRVMPSGTRFATMDVYCRKGTLSAGIINFIGAGDYRLDISSHKGWEHLKSRCSDYGEDTYNPFKLLRCSVVVASGVKLVQIEGEG